MMPAAGDVTAWEEAQAEYMNPAGGNASEHCAAAIDAAQRMGAIEARWEFLPGGFSAGRERFREHVKKVVDGMPPLTDEQLCKLALLLGQP